MPPRAGSSWANVLVSDGADVSTPELLQQMATALRIGARLFPVSPSLLHAAARLAGKRELAVSIYQVAHALWTAGNCEKLPQLDAFHARWRQA